MNYLSNLWDVLLLFLIPIGGGIPGGVLLAKTKGFGWPVMMILYFISDVILAIAFEPLMILFIKLGKKIQFFARIGEMMKHMVKKTIEHYGNKSGVLPLIMIAFGVDPMTGRGVAAVAGHGFLTGWMIAIAGDMIYFTVLMISTLWVKSLVGNEFVTILIILVIMIIFPQIYRRLQNKFSK
jgi:hypothetical protein